MKDKEPRKKKDGECKKISKEIKERQEMKEKPNQTITLQKNPDTLKKEIEKVKNEDTNKAKQEQNKIFVIHKKNLKERNSFLIS